MPLRAVLSSRSRRGTGTGTSLRWLGGTSPRYRGVLREVLVFKMFLFPNSCQFVTDYHQWNNEKQQR